MPPARRHAPTEAGKPRSGPQGRIHWSFPTSGGILGFLAALAVLEVFGNPVLQWWWAYLPVVGAGVGALLALTRARVAMWVFGALVCAAYGGLAYSPVVGTLVRGLSREDSLDARHPVEAAVVLSSGIYANGDFTPMAQYRLVRGYEVVRAGYAKRLVVTRLAGAPSYLPAVRRQLDRLRISLPVEETEPVMNTHDEAVVCAAMARQRGWKRVVLVSGPTHMRRAAAVFEKAGLAVLCAPSATREYDVEALNDPTSRIRAFHDWLHEWAGYVVYRKRGWL